jgi:ABC-type branched-subunit amino acid transport system substrate-binding protein
VSATIVGTNEKDLTKFAFSLQQLAQGRSNAVGTVTLRASQTTTTVTAPNCGAGSRVFLFPATANAAAVVAMTYVLAANVTAGQFIITHASDADVDQTFYWVALG